MVCNGFSGNDTRRQFYHTFALKRREVYRKGVLVSLSAISLIKQSLHTAVYYEILMWDSMANFYFGVATKNLSFFRVSKKSTLLQMGYHSFIMYFFTLAFYLSSPSLHAQYSPEPELNYDSTEIQEKLENLKWNRMKARRFYPKIDRSKAFFCRWEYAIEQNTRIPFRFRLGSLNYVNQLEKKK